MNTNWQPSINTKNLHKRAEYLAQIRSFFAERNVLEVETPLLAHAPVTDPYLDAFAVEMGAKTAYLQTSPEYAMKRLLAAGSGCIYQLCKAFRQDEEGKLHSPEFTMLEWYRVGFDDYQLMDEVSDLLQMVLATGPAEKITYQAAFERYLGVNPHAVECAELQKLVTQKLGTIAGLDNPSKDDCLQLLMSEVIEPELGKDVPALIYNYPASQSALARLKEVDGTTVAARFEAYYHGVELANGYYELTDYAEQKRRFEQDLAVRKKLGRPAVPVDDKLLDAIESGLPDCAGVALGFDRLLMLSLDLKGINEIVLST